MTRLREWRRAKWREVFPSEGALIEHLSLREHFWLAVLRPGGYRCWLSDRFHRWSVQPDDLFYEMVTDRYYRVQQVRREYVIAEPFDGQLVWYVERGKLSASDPGLIRIAESYSRPLPASWMRTRKTLPL